MKDITKTFAKATIEIAPSSKMLWNTGWQFCTGVVPKHHFMSKRLDYEETMKKLVDGNLNLNIKLWVNIVELDMGLEPSENEIEIKMEPV